MCYLPSTEAEAHLEVRKYLDLVTLLNKTTLYRN